MDIIRNTIYLQNKHLLQTIADDMFTDQEQKDTFLLKYHKKNFSFFQIKRNDPIESYHKKINALSKKKK